MSKLRGASHQTRSVTAPAERSRGSCVLAAVSSVCWWHSALWLFFSRSRWSSFPFFLEPGQYRRLDENQLAVNLPRRSARCKVWGDGQEEQPKMWLQVVTALSQPDSAHLCQEVWPFLSISRIRWLSFSHLMNFTDSIYQHNTSHNRMNRDFSWSHFQVRVLQGAGSCLWQAWWGFL